MLRRSARVASRCQVLVPPALAPLPLPVVLHIFALLPVDVRLRCREVCRGWRAALEERAVWTRLSFQGCVWRLNDGALLHAAVARAKGALESLDVRSLGSHVFDVIKVLEANTEKLRELHCSSADLNYLPRILAAAPRLQVCRAMIHANGNEIGPVLRNEAPFGAVRIEDLRLVPALPSGVGWPVLAQELASHASLKHLVLHHAPLNLPEVADAIVDAAIALRLESLSLDSVPLNAGAVLALTRLLRANVLTKLHLSTMATTPPDVLDNPHIRLLGGDALFLEALRGTTALSVLELRFYQTSNVEVSALLRCLTAHPTIKTLKLCGGFINEQLPAVGALLCALVAADTLDALDISFNYLGDEELGPLVNALPRLSRLSTLDIARNRLSYHFVLRLLLPAVRANASLRKLLWELPGERAAGGREVHALLQEAAQLVANRQAL